MSIVMGMAIDFNSETNKYELTYEIVDLASGGGDGSQTNTPTSRIVTSEGSTLFDSVRNGKNELANKLYFSHMQTIIVSEQLAINEGLNPLMDLFMRDSEPRETTVVVISKESSAKALLMAKPVDSQFISQQINEVITESKSTNSHAPTVDLLKTYTVLKSEGISLVVPVLHCVQSDQGNTIELDGLAVFKEDKLVGYLTLSQVYAYMLIVNESERRALPIDVYGNDLNDTTLEVASSKTKRSFTNSGDHITVTLNVSTDVYIDENETMGDVTKKEAIDKVKNTAEQNINDRIETLIQDVISEYHSDIFGFGSMIYKKNPKLWSKIKDQDYLENMEFKIQSKVQIKNTALIK